MQKQKEMQSQKVFYKKDENISGQKMTRSN